ncbi:MAG TPA: hypothetical protein PLD55_03890 [bacterium]|nr:hypothetical protein [bacterium]
MIVQTDGYEFDFTDAINAFKFDETNHSSPTFHGVTELKAVDIIAELSGAYLFIEIKEYADHNIFNEALGANSQDKKERHDKYKWLKRYLKYKYRDSFLYSFAEEKVDKPVHFICLLNFDNALNNKMKKDLSRELPVGKKSPRWKKKLVESCQVLNLNQWNLQFPKWPASKI